MGIADNWSRENLAWAGGLFEGEGCITIGDKVKIAIAMTDEDTIRRFAAIVGCGALYGPIRRSYWKSHYKQIWIWETSRGEYCQAILAALWPYLGERRKQKCVEAIKYIAGMKLLASRRTKCAHGHEFNEANTALNKKGHRLCRMCMRASSKAWKQKIRAKKKAEKNVAQLLLGPPDGGRQLSS